MKKSGAFILAEEKEIIDIGDREERQRFVLTWLSSGSGGAAKAVEPRDLESRFRDLLSALQRETRVVRIKRA
ncbi:MAG: hypothetical protein ACE5EB_06715 [Thermodesulfobacteriota bacterium]